MAFDPNRPFNDLPDLPPASETETKAILRSCIAARAALAELRVSGGLIPNQAMLINSIPLLEAQASSEIENIVTTADRLFRYANDAAGRADPATREALRYRTGLYRGFEMLKRRPVSTAVAVEVCRTIKGVELDIRNTPGTALVNDATGEVIYTPPEGEDVLWSKLANWERYIHEATEIDPLIRLAVMHYQFEAIHPFVDGNGRTGRVLNLLYLVDQGLLDIPVLYLSRHIIRNKALYYRYLLEVTTRQDWEAWILFILEAVRTTAEWTTAKNQRDPGASRRDGRRNSTEDAENLLPGTGGTDLRASLLPDRRRGQSGYRQAPDGRHLPESSHGRRPPRGDQSGARKPLYQPAAPGASGRTRVTIRE